MKAKFAVSCCSYGDKIQPRKGIVKSTDKNDFISIVLRIQKDYPKN